MEKIRPSSQTETSVHSTPSIVARTPAVAENLDSTPAALAPAVRHPSREISPERFLAEIFNRKKGELGLPKDAARRFLNFEDELKRADRREELDQLRKECEDFIQRPRNRTLAPREQELEYRFRKEFVLAVRALKAHYAVRHILMRNARQPQLACKEYLAFEAAENREGRHDLLARVLNEELKRMDPRFRQEFVQAFRAERSKAAIDFIFSENTLRPERALARYLELEERYRREGGPQEADILRRLCRERIDGLRGIPMNRFPEVFDKAFVQERETVPVQRSSHLREALRQRREEIERDIASSKRTHVETLTRNGSEKDKASSE